jgi:hypothetical protein
MKDTSAKNSVFLGMSKSHFRDHPNENRVVLVGQTNQKQITKGKREHFSVNCALPINYKMAVSR